MYHLTRRPLAAFHVKGSPGAHGRPEALALPAAVRIVDAPIHPFCIEPQRIWDSENDPFTVLQGQQPFGRIAGVDRHVAAQPERIELIDPGVVAGLGAPGIRDALQLR